MPGVRRVPCHPGESCPRLEPLLPHRVANESERTLTLPEREFAKPEPRVSKERKDKTSVLVAFVLISLLHQWMGFALSVPALCLGGLGWLFVDWWKLRPAKPDDYRRSQRLSFGKTGKTVKRMVDGGDSDVRLARSQLDFIRIDEKDGRREKKNDRRKDFIAVLHDGTERFLLEDVLPDEVDAMTAAIEAALAPEAPKKELLKVRVENTSASYRDVEQNVMIEVPARPFVGKAPSIFARDRPKPRALQRVRVGEEVIVETGTGTETQKRELGRTKDVSLHVKYAATTADVWIHSADGEQALLLDRLDFQELASLRKALPDSLVIEK